MHLDAMRLQIMWQRHKQPTNVNNANQSKRSIDRSYCESKQTDRPTGRPTVDLVFWLNAFIYGNSYRVPIYPYAEYQWNWTAFNCVQYVSINYGVTTSTVKERHSLFIFCFCAKPLKCVLHKSTPFTRIHCFHIFYFLFFVSSHLKLAHSFCLHSRNVPFPL